MLLIIYTSNRIKSGDVFKYKIWKVFFAQLPISHRVILFKKALYKEEYK